MPARILVVEDNPDNSQLVCWMLEDEGYNVTCVDTGEACLAVLEHEHFDLILMDISLPGMCGKEATKRIRMHSEWAVIPILALTAHAIDSEQQGIWDSGVDDLLTKPIDEELLLSALKSFLQADKESLS